MLGCLAAWLLVAVVVIVCCTGLLECVCLCVCACPGTCVPVCLAAFLLRFLGWGHPKIVFVESVCRTRGLSITGRILYPVADRFLVQWPQLQQRYPLAQYVGLLM